MAGVPPGVGPLALVLAMPAVCGALDGAVVGTTGVGRNASSVLGGVVQLDTPVDPS